MKRLLWLGAGIAVGALVVRAVSKKIQSYSPQGIAAAARDSGQGVLASAHDFFDEVRTGMHEREQELHAAFSDAVALTGSLDDEEAERDGGEDTVGR